MTDLYNGFIKSLLHDIQSLEMLAAGDARVTTVLNLVQAARTLDAQLLQNLLDTKFQNHVTRDFVSPPFFESDSIKDQPWTDSTDHPLQRGEAWHQGRRATNSDVVYGLDAQGLPINPYADFGVTGRGVVGHYGPNHAVDIGALRMMANKDGQLALHALGILRDADNKPALCGGFVEFKHGGDGSYPYTRAIYIDTQAHEFFEEMVSGSIILTDDKMRVAAQDIADEIKTRQSILARDLSPREQTVISRQIETQHKLAMVREQDPQFLDKLHALFSTAKQCYAGPVLSSTRNTNQSWMETRLSWVNLDETKWQDITKDAKFPYDFSAGDDANDVLWHEIAPALMDATISGHAPLFCYLLASYLVACPSDDHATIAALTAQAEAVTGFLSNNALTAASSKLTL